MPDRHDAGRNEVHVKLCGMRFVAIDVVILSTRSRNYLYFDGTNKPLVDNSRLLIRMSWPPQTTQHVRCRAGKSVNYFPCFRDVRTGLYWRREIEPRKCWTALPDDRLIHWLRASRVILVGRSTRYPTAESSRSSFLEICRPICRPLWPQLHLRQLHIPASSRL